MPAWCQLIPQQEDINAVYKQADCFISASDCETFSYAVCEASIYGLPVIQTDIYGTKWNNNNPSTFLFHRGDSAELAARIETVAKSYSQLTRARQATRQHNLRYTLANWSEEVMEFYRRL